MDKVTTTLHDWHQRFGAVAHRLQGQADAPTVIYPARQTARRKDGARQTSITLIHRNGLRENFFVCANKKGHAQMTMDLSWESADKKEFRAYRLTSAWKTTRNLIGWLQQQRKATHFGNHFELITPPVTIKPGPPTTKQQIFLNVLRRLENEGVQKISADTMFHALKNTGISGIERMGNALERKGLLIKNRDREGTYGRQQLRVYYALPKPEV